MTWTRTVLPKIGRPNKSGISWKLLGHTEYERQRRHRLNPPSRTTARWTNISQRDIGHTAYMRIYRKLVKNRDQFIDGDGI